MSDALQYALWLASAVFVVYVLVRVGAIAWFKTRSEHARRIMREMKGEE